MIIGIANHLQREEKFFSKDVTHVVTTRPLPAESKTMTETSQSSSLPSISSQPRAINPSILDRLNGYQHGAPQNKSIFSFDASSRRLNGNTSRETELRRPAISHVDVLSRAQDLHMKIWHLEKLQRIMNTIFEVPEEKQQSSTQQSVRRTNHILTKKEEEPDLSRMLRQERLHGPSDRDVSSRTHELVLFKGPYLYVRDIDERTKPIMVKDWPKPAKSPEFGEWPQFRAASYGKCPFIEDISKEDLEKELARQEYYENQQRLKSRSRTQSRAPTPQPIYEDEEETNNGRDKASRDAPYSRALREVVTSASATYGCAG